MVRTTRPVMRASSNGVFLHFDLSSAGSSTHGASASITMTSAGAPFLSVPPGKPSNSAGRVEVARSPQEQARGLMFRTEMGPDEGMLFPYAQPQILSFWMKNTVLSLDLVFIGPDRRVVNVAANAVPYSEAPILSDAPAIATLELNAGRARELGIVAGARVDW